MSREIVHVVTVHCGIPECTNSVVCGENEKYAEDRGWKLDVPILDTYYDLCPEHLQDLQDFVAPPETPQSVNENMFDDQATD